MNLTLVEILFITAWLCVLFGVITLFIDLFKNGPIMKSNKTRPKASDNKDEDQLYTIEFISREELNDKLESLLENEEEHN